MVEFIPLDASGLSDSYSFEADGEQPLVTIEEKKDSIEISYVFPGFTMAEDDQTIDGKQMPFREVGISGAGFVSESGKPLLPSFGRFVQIPANCDYEFKVKQGKTKDFPELLITPAQEEATDAEGEEYEYDAQAYSKDEFYPANVAEVTGPFDMDDYKVLSVHVRPLQYNPAKNLLRGCGNITVVIKLRPKEEPDKDDEGVYPLIDPEANKEGFGNLMLNPGRNITERLEGIDPPMRIPIQPIVRGAEFIIIYDDKLKVPASRLAEWKNMRGIITETVSINSVGNTVAKIKAYIRGRRGMLFSRLRYVLLFGDVDKIVTEETGNTTDHYYYTRKDSTGGSDCVIPWVSGGRIPVSTEAEGNTVVDQIIKYEKNPPCDPEYYRRMTFAAYFQDDSPQDGKANRGYMLTMEGIRKHLVAQGFDVDRVYVTNNPNPQLFKDGTPVPQEVKDAIVDGDTATDMLISATSEGQLIIGHRDHGGDTGWAHPSFRSSHLPAILSHYQSIFYSINCLTGRFDANPTDSFAEAILQMDGGTPSLIAATELTGTFRNDSMMKGLFDSMWPGVIPTFPGTTASYPMKYNRLGDILNYGKSYLLVSHGTNSGVRSHFEQYHVIGDPTLQLWGALPIYVNLSAKIWWRKLIITLSSCPKGTSITIWYRGRLLKRISPSSTRITIPIRDLRLSSPTPGMPGRHRVSICFAAPGCRFTQTWVRL